MNYICICVSPKEQYNIAIKILDGNIPAYSHEYDYNYDSFDFHCRNPKGLVIQGVDEINTITNIIIYMLF